MKIEVVTGVELDLDDSPEEVLDTFEGPQVSWITEPSGALVILKSPGQLWAAYAGGAWLKVRAL